MLRAESHLNTKTNISGTKLMMFINALLFGLYDSCKMFMNAFLTGFMNPADVKYFLRMRPNARRLNENKLE